MDKRKLSSTDAKPAPVSKPAKAPASTDAKPAPVSTPVDAGPIPGTDAVPHVASRKRRKPFNYPQLGVLRNHNPGTKRALVIELTGTPEGATFEEIQDAVAEGWPTAPWDDNTCTEGIRLISKLVGYQLTEDPTTGKIRSSWTA